MSAHYRNGIVLSLCVITLHEKQLFFKSLPYADDENGQTMKRLFNLDIMGNDDSAKLRLEERKISSLSYFFFAFTSVSAHMCRKKSDLQ